MQFLQEALDNQDLQEALEITNESLSEEADMLVEALDDTFETPTESQEINDLQFFNQDHANGLSDTDLNTSFNPDNTDALNDAGRGSAADAPDAGDVGTLADQLLGEAADEESVETDLDDGGDFPLEFADGQDLEDLDDLDDDEASEASLAESLLA